MITVGFCWIVKNKIVDNSDGIVMFDASPNISLNAIQENQRSGITCCGCSYPKIESNQIFGNYQSGINIRDETIPVIIKNKIFSNFY